MSEVGKQEAKSVAVQLFDMTLRHIKPPPLVLLPKGGLKPRPR